MENFNPESKKDIIKFFLIGADVLVQDVRIWVQWQNKKMDPIFFVSQNSAICTFFLIRLRDYSSYHRDMASDAFEG